MRNFIGSGAFGMTGAALTLTGVALQTWGAVNIAFTEELVKIIHQIGSPVGIYVAALVTYNTVKLHKDRVATKQRHARKDAGTTADKSQPLQGDSVHEHDV